MKQVLIVEASHNRADNGSRFVAKQIETKLRARYPEAQFLRRDLATNPPPHLEGNTIHAFFTPPEARDSKLQSAIKLSDEFTSELLASDLVVLSVPMWNFSLPSSLKAWIDHVVRAGRTFKFEGEGAAKTVKGLVTSTKAIVVVSSGGLFSQDQWRPFDYVVPYLTHILHFIGITDVQLVRVEGTAVPESKDVAVSNALKTVEKLGL